MNSSESILISFSGLDGSGKSTQIAALREAIHHLGLNSRLITFWDDVVVATRYREGFVHKVFGSEPGIGAPGHPVERRDKNVRVGYLTLSRHLLYLADAIHLRMVLKRARRESDDIFIVDRYIYDELANLPLENRFSAWYARMLARIAPRPQLALFLDAEPEAARARKPEYSVPFLCQSRRAYYRLSRMLPGIVLIPPLPLEEAQHLILTGFLRTLGRYREDQEEDTASRAAPAA